MQREDDREADDLNYGAKTQAGAAAMPESDGTVHLDVGWIRLHPSPCDRCGRGQKAVLIHGCFVCWPCWWGFLDSLKAELRRVLAEDADEYLTPPH